MNDELIKILAIVISAIFFVIIAFNRQKAIKDKLEYEAQFDDYVLLRKKIPIHYGMSFKFDRIAIKSKNFYCDRKEYLTAIDNGYAEYNYLYHATKQDVEKALNE